MVSAPGSGKTSLSVKLFSYLKEIDNISVEYSSEVAKQWVYEGKKVNKYGQFILFGAECANQSRLINADLDVIISDSGLMLSGFYNHYYFGDDSLSAPCREFYKKVTEDGVTVLNFFLPRKKKYNPKGRYQTQEQADQIAKDLLTWLDNEGYEYEILDCSEKERLERVVEKIREVRGY